MLHKYKAYGRSIRACNALCALSFREDRKHDLIYPSYNVEGVIMSVERASVECNFCAYCGFSPE